MSDDMHVTNSPRTVTERDAYVHRANCIVALARRYLQEDEATHCPHLIGETLAAAESLLLAAEEFSGEQSE